MIPLGFFGGGKRLPAFCLGCLLLLSAGGCATERWCNDLNDYSTLRADTEHCEREAGAAGQLFPWRINSCMKSLGWHPCEDKPEDADNP